MIGFTLPLFVYGTFLSMVGFNLLLPLPFCRPGILICKMTKGPIGRTVISTISAMLIILLIAPAYDLAMLHRFKGFQGTEISSPERRESEATSQLSAVMTSSLLVTMFVLRKLGLALAELDEIRAQSGATSLFTSEFVSKAGEEAAASRLAANQSPSEKEVAPLATPGSGPRGVESAPELGYQSGDEAVAEDIRVIKGQGGSTALKAKEV